MDTDNDLLASYAAHGSESAFRELVERHINMVHSAALRESRGDDSLAEDITQAVFSELARRAPQIVTHPAIAGWLFTCVRRMTANVRRAQDRRQRREQEAYTMNELLGPDPADQLWQQVRPVLDDVMHELNQEDRTAVVLRFFEGRSLGEVGAALGLSENAARMRVERSLEKLHGLLSQRGVKSTASTLTAVLAVGAAVNASSTLASAVATGALAAAASNVLAGFTLAEVLNRAKIKVAAAGALIFIVGAIAVWHHARANRAITAQMAQSQPAVAAAILGDLAQNDFSIHAMAPTSAAASSEMAFQVVEAETGQPLDHAKLHLLYMLEDGRGKTVKAVTDANGKLGVDFPQTPFRALNLFVTADGHVPKVTSWGFGNAMPAEYTMKLERGVSIGGVVVDETGQTIAGAMIQFDGHESDKSKPEEIQFGPDTSTVTDDSGHWTCNMVPRDLDRVKLIITHPDHAEMTATIRPQALEANSSVITMASGFSMAGAVQDSNGNPIGGAKVREVRPNEEGERFKTTDASGKFEFKNMKAGEHRLAVQVHGFAPMVQTLLVSNNVVALRFQLSPGQLMRGRVTDDDGSPIANAWVEITRGLDEIKWSTTTDRDGRFEWDSAPQESLPYSFQAEGFNRVYALQLRADASDHEIKLARTQPDKDTIQITGTAVDADSHLPLDAFNVMVGQLDPESAFPFYFGTSGKKGKFTLSFPAKQLHSAYLIQIENEGYLPAVSAKLSKKDGSQELEFTLQKGSGPSGVVLLPSGEPASNATVLLCTSISGVTIDGPAHVEKGLNTTSYSTQTDESGRFSLRAATAPEGVIVVHDQGYADISIADLMATGHITLQPWGRVEGKVMLDSQAAANERVVVGNHALRYDDSGRRFTFMTFHLDAITDSAGKFSFDKVPPGQCKVFRQQLVSRTGFESHDTVVKVSAGTVTEVVLGGVGRPIIGKALLPSVTGPIDWQTVPVQLRSMTGHEPSSPPKRTDYPSTKGYIAAVKQAYEVSQAQQRYGAFCNSNGSFRVADVPAGTYQLRIEIRDFKLNAGRALDPTSELGSLVREIIVPEIAEGESAVPFDLGILELIPHQNSASAR